MWDAPYSNCSAFLPLKMWFLFVKEHWIPLRTFHLPLWHPHAVFRPQCCGLLQVHVVDFGSVHLGSTGAKRTGAVCCCRYSKVWCWVGQNTLQPGIVMADVSAFSPRKHFNPFHFWAVVSTALTSWSGFTRKRRKAGDERAVRLEQPAEILHVYSGLCRNHGCL